MRARRHVPSTTDATGDGLLREVAPTMAFATGVLRGRNDGSCGAGLLASFRSERRASAESFYRSIAKATPRPDDGFCDGRFTRSKRWLMWSWTTRSIRSGRSGFKGVFFFLKYGFFAFPLLLITRGRLLRDRTRDGDESYYCSRQTRPCKRSHSQSYLSER